MTAELLSAKKKEKTWGRESKLKSFPLCHKDEYVISTVQERGVFLRVTKVKRLVVFCCGFNNLKLSEKLKIEYNFFFLNHFR